MAQRIDFKAAERRVFRTSFGDGLWDLFLGCFFLIFAIAPYLSASLGDFWSSVVFVPFWAVVFLAIRLVRKRVVAPRIGVVRFGPAGRSKLAKFSVVMLVVNSIALVLGLVGALSFGRLPGHVYSFSLGLILLAGFSISAWLLDFNRLYVYGLLVGLLPFAGEWLWAHNYASHHGFPFAFGIASGIMMLVGLTVFLRFIRDNPVPPREGIPFQDA
jgi:hypothetical protein